MTRAKDKPAKPPERLPTLADVAHLAGVVAMTASRAINSTGYVSDEVRGRVLKAARQLNYRPNMLARQLKSRRLDTVGVLIPDISNPFSAVLLEAVKQVLEEAGITVFIATTNRSVEQEQKSLQAFADHRVDGLIVATRGTKIGDSVLKQFARRNIPIVTIGRPHQIPGVDRVTADHAQGAYDATRHLLELGHTRIGFIGISPEDSGTLHRYAGYLKAMRQAGINPPNEYTVGPPGAPAFATQEDGFEGMLRLGGLPKPPTAIFARNDFAAIGAMRAAHTLGLRIPEDIAIAGFDNIPLAAFTTPPLTTVEQPIVEQGATAARFLLDRIQGKAPARSRAVTMPCSLIIRESTSNPAENSARIRSSP